MTADGVDCPKFRSNIIKTCHCQSTQKLQSAGRGCAITCGLYAFYLSKTYIDSHRYEAMKARERISKVTEDVDSLTRNKVDYKELEKLDQILQKLSNRK